MPLALNRSGLMSASLDGTSEAAIPLTAQPNFPRLTEKFPKRTVENATALFLCLPLIFYILKVK